MIELSFCLRIAGCQAKDFYSSDDGDGFAIEITQVTGLIIRFLVLEGSLDKIIVIACQYICQRQKQE